MPRPIYYCATRLLTAMLCCLTASPAVAQQSSEQRLPPVEQQVPQQSAQPPQPVPVPQGFQLNQLQQAFLNQVLDAWQRESGKIDTFKCDFERLDYNAAFGPAANIPLSIDKGTLSFQKPDKGSFQITEIKKWQVQPADPNQPAAPVQGNWVAQKDAIGEHWVCDGQSVFEYRHDQKQLVERPIPPEMQGQAIVDGPLPFLFGAETAKLNARYWIRIVEEHPAKDEIRLDVLPRFQADAANYSRVDVILDRQRVLPKAMQIHMPDRSRHVYKFDLANASVNSTLQRLGNLFQRPRKPIGWTHVVDAPPIQQAAQAAEPPR